MQDKILDPDPWDCRSVICLYGHGFKTLWKFVVQYLFGEAQRVSDPSVSGRVVACSRLLLCLEFIPNWYLDSMSIWVTIVPRRGVSFRSVDGPGCPDFLIQMLMQIVCSISSHSIAVVERYVLSPGRIILWWNGLVVEFWQ